MSRSEIFISGLKAWQALYPEAAEALFGLFSPEEIEQLEELLQFLIDCEVERTLIASEHSNVLLGAIRKGAMQPAEKQ